MKKLVIPLFAIISVQAKAQGNLIQEFLNSSDYSHYVSPFISQNFSNLTVNLHRSTVNYMVNSPTTPIITIAYSNSSGSIKVSVEALKLTNDTISTPNNSPYLIQLRDFSNIDSINGNCTLSLYDLSYDGYKFAEITITNWVVSSTALFDMPKEIEETYSSVISSNAEYVRKKMNEQQAQCDYNHNGNLSFGECYKCFNSACQGNPNCNAVCYLFGDVIGWVYSPGHIPYCQFSIGLACIYLSLTY